MLTLSASSSHSAESPLSEPQDAIPATTAAVVSTTSSGATDRSASGATARSVVGSLPVAVTAQQRSARAVPPPATERVARPPVGDRRWWRSDRRAAARAGTGSGPAPVLRVVDQRSTPSS